MCCCKTLCYLISNNQRVFTIGEQILLLRVCRVATSVRMFAILDRQVGKRTLEKLKANINEQPDWLQYFYNLRFEADNI